ncbi:MAG TPA: hypothetical protein VHN73_08625 [Phenylobacterium sp.]|nr:hypothetical protein [Phenylobacterium sp.]
MDRTPKTTPAAELGDATASLIDDLMALPVKGRPAITLVGDDDVVGFDPPREIPESQGPASSGSSPKLA